MALHIYTDISYLSEQERETMLDLSDAVFDNDIGSFEITDEIAKVIKDIDGSDCIGGARVRTAFGEIVELNYLSTGCKVAINVLRYPDRVVSCLEAGSNVTRYILHYKTGKVYMPLVPSIVKDFAIDVIEHGSDGEFWYTSAKTFVGRVLRGKAN